MFYLRLFLCINAYPEISDETFNEAAGDDLVAQSAMTYQVQNHHETHTGLLRESSDISNLVMFNRQQFATTNHEDDSIAFDSNPTIVQPSNMQTISDMNGSVNQGITSSVT